jgi:MFS family permease
LTTHDQEASQAVRRNYRHNLAVNVLDGTFFWCGASFIASSTILPVYVSHFTDNKLVIGLLSMIGMTGWLLPQLLTANWVQRLPRKKVLPVNLGLFTERLPVVFLALSTAWALRAPTLALVTFFVTYAWHAFGAGVVAVAWQDMVAKIIPAHHRGRFFGITNFLGTATGVIGAAGAAWVLDRYAFPTGYTWSFGTSAALMLISWIFLALTREQAEESAVSPVSYREYWRRLPSVLRADPNFRSYLLSQAVISFGGMAVGFLTVYAVQRWRLPDGQAGIYTASMLIGQAVSNLLFGLLADRRGHKVVLELSTLLGILGVGLAALAPSPSWFYAVYVLLGANTAGLLLSGLMIALEFCPADLRPTYIGLNNTVRGVASGLAPILGGWLAQVAGFRPLFAIACAIGLFGLAMLRWSVREPRQVHSSQSAQTVSSVEH